MSCVRAGKGVSNQKSKIWSSVKGCRSFLPLFPAVLSVRAGKGVRSVFWCNKPKITPIWGETGQSIVFVIGLRFVAPTNAHFMFNKQENRKRAKTREVKGKWELKGTLLPSLLGKTYIIRFFDFLLLHRK